jgi:hypothetical protein
LIKFSLLQEDNRKVLKADCSNHASDGLDGNIDIIILIIYGQFSVSTKGRKKLKSFFSFVDAKWWESVCHMPTRWLSPTSALNRLVQN